MEKYDVFISFKSEDSKIAKNVHRFLTENGLSVFFSDVTLDNIGVAEYSDIIDRALENSTHMVVIVSNIDYLNSGWVHYEWTSFLNDIKCGYKSGNLVTIIPPEIKFAELPVGLRHRQSFTTKAYEENIISYLSQTHAESKPKKKLKIKLGYIFALAGLLLLIGGATLFAKYNTKVYPYCISEYTIDLSDTLIASNLIAKIGENEDINKVISTFEIAKNGSRDAQFQIGSLCYKTGNYDDALYWFVLSSKQGDVRAANGIGRCYYNGYGVKRWPRNAFNWFVFSAEGGCPEGMNNVGKCYEEGYGVMWINEKKATKYYEAAANLGYVPAQWNAGRRYFYGTGVEKQVEKGIQYLKNAANQGSSSAQFMLGNIYVEGLQKIEIDTTEAVKWYQMVLKCTDEKLKNKAERKLQSLRE